METTIHLTDCFILAIIAIIVIYDVLAAWHFGPCGTVSHSVRYWTRRYLWLAVIVGILIGHWFF